MGERNKGGDMKERTIDWLFMFGVCLSITWLGALATWYFPSLSSLPAITFGLYFSGMSFIGCGLGWLLGGRQSDC